MTAATVAGDRRASRQIVADARRQKYEPGLSLSINKIILIFKRENTIKQLFIVDFYTHYINAQGT